MDSPEVRRAKRASLFLREITNLFFQVAQDNPALRDLYPSRITFSSDKGICTVWFFSPHGKEYFVEKLHDLKLYKPSLRTAMAKQVPMRRVPDFIFEYDDQFEKQKKVEDLLNKLKVDEKF